MNEGAICEVVRDAIQHVNDTASRFGFNDRAGVTTYPVLFFGDVLSAKVLTVGLNPSADEFVRGGWPKSIGPEELTRRLLRYFESNPHPWFNRWETALRPLGINYRNGAAHVDLSPRATISQRAVPLFEEMLAADLEFMFRIVSLASTVRLLLMAGTATKVLYINEFVARHANGGRSLTRRLTTPPARGKVLWHELTLGQRRLPVYFCSSSPSDINVEILCQRIARDRDALPKAIDWA